MRERPQQSYVGKIVLIAWREFRHTALTKGFIIGAVAMPIVMFGVIALMPKLLSQKAPPLVGTIVVVIIKNLVATFTQRWLLVLGVAYILTILYARSGIVGSVGVRLKKWAAR